MALEPITRAEQIMSGESLEPITREEMFLAKAAGMDVDTPEPITRREMFLSKISGGSGGGSAPVLEPLTVTENGTYTPPEGVDGFSEVIAAIQNGGSGDDTVNILNDVIARKITTITSNAPGVGVAAFKNCYNLLYAKFPEATYVYGEAFYDCSAMKTLDLPKATKLVGKCLYGTNHIEALILRSTTVCTLGDINAFLVSAISSGGTGYIYVPSALVESYKAATNWSTLETQFRALEHYTVDGTITGELDENKV